MAAHEGAEPEAGIDIDAYRDRVGYDGPLEPTIEVLDALQVAHQTSIAFENIDVLLSRSMPLDSASVANKLVTNKRGGWCFEQNRLFADVLRWAGFDVTDLAARVRPPGATRVTPRGHMMLRVELDGRDWLADVGFGGTAPLHPVPMDGSPVDEGDVAFRVVESEGSRVLQRWDGAKWGDLYVFTLEPTFPVDYEMSSHFMSSHQMSPFIRTFTLQIATTDGRHIVRDRTYTIASGLAEQTSQLTPAELESALDETFRIQVTRDDRATLLALVFPDARNERA